MEIRVLPNSGLQVSIVGLGCNNLGGRIDAETSCKVVRAALDAGITLLDTADVYPRGNPGTSEENLGKALGKRRKDVIVATKFGRPMGEAWTSEGGSRRYIMSAVEDSLRRLSTDWIDLYQFHYPDRSTPIEETLRALDDLITQGKVRYIGCSNFAAWQVVEAQLTARQLGINAFVTAQDQYSLLARDLDDGRIEVMEKYGLGLLPFFPLASGLLTGKYKRTEAVPANTRFAKSRVLADRFLTDKNWDVVEGLETFCKERGHNMLELAFSWLAAQPVLSSIIAGASTPEQIQQNIKAVEWVLSDEDMAEIDLLTGIGGGIVASQ